jgi:hypothetical protein
MYRNFDCHAQQVQERLGFASGTRFWVVKLLQGRLLKCRVLVLILVLASINFNAHAAIWEMKHDGKFSYLALSSGVLGGKVVITLFDFSMNLGCRPSFALSVLNSKSYGNPVRVKEYPKAFFRMLNGNQKTDMSAFRFVEYLNGWELSTIIKRDTFETFLSGASLKFEVYMDGRFVIGSMIDLNDAKPSIMKAKSLCESKLNS